MGMIKLDEIRAKADAAFSDILKVATEWKQTVFEIPGVGAAAYPLERFKFTGTVEDVNKMFFERGWSLGLPIIPPTPELVEAMLKGTSRKPDEVLWLVPQRQGVLTVELIAVHAVMAGCKPEHMPLLIASIEGFKEIDWAGATATTHPNAPVVIVNGPIVKELDIGYDQGAAGPGYPASLSIGYAINLIGDVVGGSVPGVMDMTTLGWQGNTIATVIGENEDRSPWDPYHVENGYQETDNVVTVFLGGPPLNINDHDSVAGEDLLDVIAHSMSYAGQNTRCFSDRPAFLLVSYEHAATLAEDGWTKDEIREFLWQNARPPFKALPPKASDIKKIKEELGEVTPDTPIPNWDKPERIQIVVAGGAGKHSQYFPGFRPAAMVKVGE